MGVEVRASLARSRCSPSTPVRSPGDAFGQEVAFDCRPGAPQWSPSMSVRSQPWTKLTIAVAHWFTTEVQAASGAEPQIPHSWSCCAHQAGVRLMYGAKVEA